MDADPFIIKWKTREEAIEARATEGLVNNQKQFRNLGAAGQCLLEFALLFLAYHDSETDDGVTISTLERAARAAVAAAEGSPCISPMNAEMIEALKEDYLRWTGGFAPDGDDEIFAYCELTLPFEYDYEEARQHLKRWMEEEWRRGA
jgi:hypothetical protein